VTGSYPTLGFDPAPGDVHVVQNLHQSVAQVADRLSAANGALRQLGRGDGVWQGQAAQAFARRVGELPQHLADGENSMSAACRALSTWSAALVDFQRRAAAYERQAADAAVAVSSARTATSAIARPDANASQAEVEEATQQAAQAKRKLDAASDELSRIISRAHRLLAEHDEMARRVAKSLRDASDVAPAKPGVFQQLGSALSDAMDFVVSLPGKVWNWVKDHADLIGDILSDISTVLGVAAIVCMYFPPLEVAAGVLFTVSAGFALGALATHGLAKAEGADVSWGTIALDSLGVLTWGVGKVAEKGMENASAMYKVGLATHEVTGFETGAEVIGAANFLHYARIWKGSVMAGVPGLVLDSFNPWFGNIVGDVKKGWDAVGGHGSPDALGATFVNGVGGAHTRRSERLAPA
jgi:VIT1/CCC1 family predicted Fe2+/Mn2+ transporter